MLLDIFAIIAPIFICTAVGYGWVTLGYAYDEAFVSRLISNLGAPCLILGALSSTHIDPIVLSTIIRSVLLMLVLSMIVAALCTKLLSISMRSFVGPLVFPNTGNMGIPLCLFAFGELGVPYASAVFAVVSLVHFSLGLALVGRGDLSHVLKSPIFYASLFGLLIAYFGIQLPRWGANTLNLVGNMAIPLMLITLGVSIAQLKVKSLSLTVVLASVRIVAGFIIGVVIVEVLALDGVVAGVIIIQSAMPVAVFNYLLALSYKRDHDIVAGMVVASTFMSFMTLPVLLWFVLNKV